MATIEELLKNSSCFGVAFDGSVKECKICEVKTRCEAKCRMGLGKPESIAVATPEEVTEEAEAGVEVKKVIKKNATKKSKKSVKEAAAKPKVEYTDDMPEFKSMSTEELEKLAEERGIDISQFEKYNSPNIKRMRMTMQLKKTYEKK